MRSPEQLKGQIRSFAKKHKLMSQEVLQMYLFERVLERLAASECEFASTLTFEDVLQGVEAVGNFRKE